MRRTETDLASPDEASPQGAEPQPAPSLLPHGTRLHVRQFALLGNSGVGKTTLFEALCSSGGSPVNLEGHVSAGRHGVLTRGPAATPRALRRRCATCPACRHHGSLCPAGEAASGAACPAVASLPERSAGPAPGVTHLYDTPGTPTLAASGEDAVGARDLLLSGRMDGVLFVADAKNLRRSLALALEVAEFGVPMVLALNMCDEAENLGLVIDAPVLERALGVPLVRTVAVERRGVRRLASLLLHARPPVASTRFPEVVEEALAELQPLLESPRLPARALALLLLAKDRGAVAAVREALGEEVRRRAQAIVDRAQARAAGPLDILIANAFHDRAGWIVERASVSRAKGAHLARKLGSVAQHPLWGSLVALGVLALSYLWVGLFGASFLAETLATRLFDGYVFPLCRDAVAHVPWAFARDALMDPDFGVLPTGLFLAVGAVLPVLFCFYVLQAVLEDSGYLPRLALLLDRLLGRLGLTGQALIPLLLGFSCVTMALITGRSLPTRKERFILALIVLGLPCAPLLAVMMVIFSALPVQAALLVFGLVAARVVAVGLLTSRALPGRRSDFILEIPQLRWPRLGMILVRSWRRTWEFLREALPFFLAASFAVFLFARAGGLTAIERLAHPLVHAVLGLPDEAVRVFIKTAIRRENGATELSLLRGQFTHLQLVVTLLVMTLVLPCLNSLLVVYREWRLKAGSLLLALSVTVAVGAGALVNHLCRALGIAF